MSMVLGMEQDKEDTLVAEDGVGESGGSGGDCLLLLLFSRHCTCLISTDSTDEALLLSE